MASNVSLSFANQIVNPLYSTALVFEGFAARPVDIDILFYDDITIEDRKDYAQPWKGQQIFKLRPGWHLMEYVCEEMAEPRK